MKEPPRLREGDEDVLAATLLDAARAYRRPPSSRTRILKMLGIPTAVVVGAPAWAGSASFLITKVVFLVAVVGVVTGGGMVAYHVHARHEAQQARFSRTWHATSSPAARSPIAAAARALEPSAVAPVAHPLALTFESRQPQALKPRPSRRSAPVTPVGFAATRTAPDPAGQPAARPAPARSVSSPPGAAIDKAPRVVADIPPPASSPRRQPLAREFALLDAADRAERQHDHRGALASLDQYARAFPDGALLAEEQVLRIAALLGSGDDAAARMLARSFLARYAPSPLAAHVRSMLARKSRQIEELP